MRLLHFRCRGVPEAFSIVDLSRVHDLVSVLAAPVALLTPLLYSPHL